MSRKIRKIPAEILQEFFSYDPKSGEIHYRAHRARHWFKSDRLWKSWNAQFGGTVASHIGGDGYRAVTVNQCRYLAHRVIWAMVTGEWPKDEIDHINGDRGDNRWLNLRAQRAERMRATWRCRITTLREQQAFAGTSRLSFGKSMAALAVIGLRNTRRPLMRRSFSASKLNNG